MARPVKPKSQKFSSEIRVKVRPGLKERVHAAAEAEYLDESAFLRSLLEKELGRAHELARG
jgi:hypothetical protein